MRPYTWSITQGSLPAGLTLVPATGLISGRPSAAGTSDFTVAVSDSETPAVTATAAESITVNVSPPAVTTTSLPQATVGVRYSARLAGSGGIRPYAWSLFDGALPAGLSFQPASGVISGTPTAGGTASFTVQFSDAEAPPQVTQAASLTLVVGVAPLVVTTASTLPQGTVGVPYSTRMDATGGVRPYTWSFDGGRVPAGLTVHRNGTISGTPEVFDGPHSFQVKVTDSAGSTATVIETILITPVLAVTTTSLPPGSLSSPDGYVVTLQDNGGGFGPYTWSVVSGSLPAGLFLNPDGTISGIPDEQGEPTFTVQVTDSGNPAEAATATLSIDIGL